MQSSDYNGMRIVKSEIDKIEFRSEEVREILGAIPHWTIRSGSGYLLVLIIVSLIISWFIKYPDIVIASGNLTTKYPPVNVITKSPGYVTLFVKEDQSISAGQTIGYLSSTANVNDVLELQKKLDSFKTSFYSDPGLIHNYKCDGKLILGDIQEDYNQFKNALSNYQFFARQKSNLQRSLPLKAEIMSNSVLAKQIQNENAIRLNELQLARKSFERDSVLYAEKVISGQEYEQKKREYLSNIRTYQNAVSGLTNRQIDRIQLYGKINDLHLEDQKQNDDLLQQVEMSMNNLDSRLKQWEDLYLIRSQVAGKVALFSYWANNQFIKSGEEIVTIIPENKNYIVRAKVPVAGSGKIKPGQKVNIKLYSYPANEYGMLGGKVQSMSLIPKEDKYYILVQMPDSLVTTYGKKIDFKQEMPAACEIITEDLSLLDRFFYQFRNLANRK